MQYVEIFGENTIQSMLNFCEVYVHRKKHLCSSVYNVFLMEIDDWRLRELGCYRVGRCLEQALLQKCCDYLGWGDRRLRFPGTQPVSLTRHSVDIMVADLYLVCEKTDGERHLLLQTNDKIYLLDRSNRVLITNLKAVARSKFHSASSRSSGSKETSEGKKISPTKNAENVQLDDSGADCLLDGELVVDKYADGREELIFLVFDAMVIFGRDITFYNMVERLQIALKQFVQSSRCTYPAISCEGEPRVRRQFRNFQFAMKDFFDLRDFKQLRNIKYPHESDGFIFSPVVDKYVPSTSTRLFKWKPPELNTIDFQLRVEEKESKERAQAEERDTRIVLHMMEKDLLKPYADLANSAEEILHILQDLGLLKRDTNSDNFNVSQRGSCDEILSSPEVTYQWIHDKIWECRYSMEKRGWILHRIRCDKNFPNSEHTVRKVQESIRDNLTLAEIWSKISTGSAPRYEEWNRGQHMDNSFRNLKRRRE